MANELNISDPAKRPGLTVVARLYAGGALALTVPLANEPAGSPRYTNPADLTGLPAGRYDVEFDAGDAKLAGVGELRWSGSAEAAAPGAEGPPPAGSYLSVAAADALAATLPAAVLAAYLPADTPARASALLLGSADVDGAMRYQGRTVDPAQPNAFPRVAYEPSTHVRHYAGGPRCGEQVWDLDPITGLAVVPARVLRAVLFQADALLRPDSGRLAAQHEGLRSKTTGPLSETYAAGTAAAAETGLCLRAYQLMAYYRLASGRLL